MRGINGLCLDHSVSVGNLGSIFTPWGRHVLGDMHAKIAEIYRVQRAFVSTGGTTVANKLALYTLVSPGDIVLLERDCHISMLQSLNEIGAQPVWMTPPHDPDLGVNLCITSETLTRYLEDYPTASAVVLTYPKYFGVAGDIRACIEAAHNRGVPVLVDEAHGDCLPFHSELPRSATAAGADIVTQSTHKSTEASSQGSLLLIDGRELGITDELCRRFLHVLNGTPAISTSFNYEIIASVEEAVTNLHERGQRRLTAALELAELLRDGIRKMPPLVTWGAEQIRLHRPGFTQFNPLRVTVDVSHLGLSGFEVEDRLQRSDTGLTPVVAEFGDLQHILFLVSYGHTTDDVAAVLDQFQALLAETRGSCNPQAMATIPQNLPPRKLLPREAFWRVAEEQTERVLVAAAVGRISAETIAVYPPGNAIVVQGEEVTDEVVTYLQAVVVCGAHLKGATDPDFKTMLVIDGSES